ncbi:MAG: O-antigen ligase domain-containing protein [Pegethrix bostrychoides GSE-TBD4-15B]|uniref:O-antigen ligase domain-containing protein n=1 Tax=Pegethrix bostrychoides GSE-TBD4-15B TaxID=2839662 RepID=A0A951PFM2_9CYAN|nr:O-antigen ligase domain-containing protein [Pegethrix bostrychoides GSE-TBD4-15B]
MNSSIFLKKAPHLFQPAIAWIGILGLIALTLFCLVTGLGRVLNLTFPAGAILVGLLLYIRYPVLYLGFTWWLWFLAPLVRRLADYRSAFTDPSPILLAPYLVALLALGTVVRHLPKSRREGSLPFVISVLGVLYGYLIGLIKSAPISVSISLLEWITPIAFGYHIYINWRSYIEYKQTIQKAFLWFALLAGAYGVFQYIVAPEWDSFWLTNVIASGSLSFGRPEPLMIRVWSTMHAPGVFASAMAAALLLLFSYTGVLLPITATFGYLSFLLCQGRSGWLVWAVGLLILFPSLKQRLQMRLLITLSLMIICITPLVTIKPFSDVANSRFQSFSNLEGDHSAIERQAVYDYWFGRAATSIVGAGTGGITRSEGVVLDSAVLDLLLSLGWFGTAFYMSGLALLVIRLFLGASQISDPFANAARALALSIICQLPLGSVMLGFQGMVLWSFLGIGLAARKFELSRQITEQITERITEQEKYHA